MFAVWLLEWQVISREEEFSQAVLNLKLTKAEWSTEGKKLAFRGEFSGFFHDERYETPWLGKSCV